MDTKSREKEKRNNRFAREEMGELLRMFSSLGVTVALGIVGSFLLGLWVDRKLAGIGYATYGIPRVLFLLGGVALTVYWAYLRIARHLEKFGEKGENGSPDASSASEQDGSSHENTVAIAPSPPAIPDSIPGTPADKPDFPARSK